MDKVIFDCDNTMGIPFKEVDDGLTILYLLGEPGLELLGVTTTFGNGTIEQVFPQTRKLIHHLGLKIPVIAGEGSCGQAPDTDAAKYLVEMVNQHPHEISLLATGPLGNLHAAAKLDPSFFQKVRRVVCMGGYLEPVILGRRNLGELNLSANPEASLNVLSAPCPVTLFPAQVCLDAPYRLKDIRQARFWPYWFKVTLFQWLATFGFHTGEMTIYLWDLLPAVFLTAPEIFSFEEYPLLSSLSDMQEGVLIKSPSGLGPVISLATTIKDRPGFYEQLETAWRRAIISYSF